MKRNAFLALGIIGAVIMSGGCKGRERAAAQPDGSEGAMRSITVSCYDSMAYKNFLDMAAKAFTEKYPGTTVTIETFSAMPEVKTSENGDGKMILVQRQDDTQSRNDYINRINTSLMSGGGADIFAADILPLHTYVESGWLENLDAFITGDNAFNMADVRGNIIDASRYNGGLYVMPIDYSFQYFAYDGTLLQGAITAGFGTDSAFTSSDLIENAAPLFDGSAKIFNLYDFSPDGMIKTMWNERYTSFIDLEKKRANFTGGEFAAMLTTIREYGDKSYIPHAVSRQDTAERIRQAGQQATGRYFFKPYGNFSLLSQFGRAFGRTRMMGTAGGAKGIADDDEIAGIAAREDGTVPYTFGNAFCINANSKNKHTAWEFIKFLLTEDMQMVTSSPNPEPLPLNNAARVKKAELAFSDMLMGRAAELDEKQRAALAAYIEAVEWLSDRISAYTFQDTVINDMLAAEIRYFADGSRSAEEVARVLQNKAELYLNE
ncbi:MAG: extracellular solute-binding protein [Treponema sp.]|jgi:multiple sugar transport system substrate-binding protein|nr:extracellular solute-binding protein [Treponema sp.]